jgi:hypothetical protein
MEVFKWPVIDKYFYSLAARAATLRKLLSPVQPHSLLQLHLAILIDY